MGLPTGDTVSKRAGLPTNDTRGDEALVIALSWAQVTLGRGVADALADLNATGYDAIEAYAVDVLRVPKLQTAMAAGEIDPSMIPYDIGRRWETALCRGNKLTWALA